VIGRPKRVNKYDLRYWSAFMTDADFREIIMPIKAQCLSFEHSFWRMMTGREEINNFAIQKFRSLIYKAHTTINLHNDIELRDTILDLIANLYSKCGHFDYAKEPLI
jgi:hypothetical protein